jgi:hypothetical protein
VAFLPDCCRQRNTAELADLERLTSTLAARTLLVRRAEGEEIELERRPEASPRCGRWQTSTHTGNKDEKQTSHGTQKPVELMRRPILNHTERGDVELIEADEIE